MSQAKAKLATLFWRFSKESPTSSIELATQKMHACGKMYVRGEKQKGKGKPSTNLYGKMKMKFSN